MIIAFLIGFIVGGLVGCNSPRTNTNTPPTPPKFKRGRK